MSIHERIRSAQPPRKGCRCAVSSLQLWLACCAAAGAADPPYVLEWNRTFDDAAHVDSAFKVAREGGGRRLQPGRTRPSRGGHPGCPHLLKLSAAGDEELRSSIESTSVPPTGLALLEAAGSIGLPGLALALTQVVGGF